MANKQPFPLREVPCPRTDPHGPHDAHSTPDNPGSLLAPDVRCPGIEKNNQEPDYWCRCAVYPLKHVKSIFCVPTQKA